MYDHGTLSQLIEVLSTLRNLPPIRSKPLPGDVPGDFDRWFDGGAVKIVTGWSTYTFANGCRATTDTSLVWRVGVTLADGREFALADSGGPRLWPGCGSRTGFCGPSWRTPECV